MRTISNLVLMCFMAMPVCGAQPGSPPHPDYETVKAVIEVSIGWAMTKDVDRLFEIFADDDQLLIWWVGSAGGANGIDDLKETARRVWMTPDFRATRFDFRDLKITFSASGDVAWFSCRLDDCGVWKGDEFCMENIRNTGVLERRGGRWVIVQSHASWPVDGLPESVLRRIRAGENGSVAD